MKTGRPKNKPAPKPLAPITAFRGEHRWLSNFWPAEVRYGGLVFPTVENAYQAAKVTDPGVRKQFQFVTPEVAKMQARTVMLRSDWDEVKVTIMDNLVRQKFMDPYLSACLQGTDGRQIVEGNWWGDKFWGQCPVGNGQNVLGRLLMKVREDLVAGIPLLSYKTANGLGIPVEPHERNATPTLGKAAQ